MRTFCNLILFLFLSGIAYAGNSSSLPPSICEEADGSPTGPCFKVVYPNGSLSFAGSTATFALTTGSLPSGATLDTEWDTIAEIETATSVNILTSTELDTLAELNALIGDADVASLGGSETFSGAKIFNAAVDLNSITREFNSNVTCADDGAGTAAACDLDPATNFVRYTCSDADGCEVSLVDAGSVGRKVIIVNVGTNNVVIKNIANHVFTIGGTNRTLGAKDNVTMYTASGSEWVQVAEANV